MLQTWACPSVRCLGPRYPRSFLHWYSLLDPPHVLSHVETYFGAKGQFKAKR